MSAGSALSAAEPSAARITGSSEDRLHHGAKGRRGMITPEPKRPRGRPKKACTPKSKIVQTYRVETRGDEIVIHVSAAHEAMGDLPHAGPDGLAAPASVETPPPEDSGEQVVGWVCAVWDYASSIWLLQLVVGYDGSAAHPYRTSGLSAAWRHARPCFRLTPEQLAAMPAGLWRP